MVFPEAHGIQKNPVEKHYDSVQVIWLLLFDYFSNYNDKYSAWVFDNLSHTFCNKVFMN